MTFVAQATIEDMDRSPAGIGAATLGEAYEAQRAADRLGGQSYSEFDRMRELLSDQVERMRARYQADIPLNPSALFAFVNDKIEFQRQSVERGAQVPVFRRNVRDFDTLNDWLNRAHAQDPDHFKTLEQIQAQVAREAREAQDSADQVMARATGTDALLAQLGAGTVTALREPLLVSLGLLTAPIGAEALGASLFARGIGLTAARAAGIALIEAPTAAFGEYIIREGMRDFYRRQDYSDPEINARIAGDVGSAFLGGAILGPGFFLGGVAIKGVTQNVLNRLASRDMAEVLEAAVEVEKAGVEFTAQQRADLKNVEEAVRRWHDLPPFVEKSYESFVAYHDNVTRVLNTLESNAVPDDLPVALATPSIVKLKQALTDIQRGRNPTRREIQRLLNKEEFADFRGRLEETIRMNRQARIQPETAAQTRVVQAIEKATRLFEDATTPAKDIKATKARERARTLFGRLSDPEKRIFNVAEDGSPELKPAERLSRPEATRLAARTSLARAIQRRLDRGTAPAPGPLTPRQSALQADITKARESLARLKEVKPAETMVKLREPAGTPQDETLTKAVEGDYDEALIRDAREDLEAESQRPDSSFTPEELAEYRAAFAEMDEDEEALEAVSQCIARSGG